MLGPINAKAKMKMNPKPELDGSNYTIPKYSILIDMESLNISKYNIYRNTIYFYLKLKLLTQYYFMVQELVKLNINI